MQLIKKLLLRPDFVLAAEPFPNNPVYEQIDKANAEWHITEVEESGWYRVRVCATSNGSYSGSPGAIEHNLYLHRGAKYLIWGASGSVTYYPNPTGNSHEGGLLGGGGGTTWSAAPGGGGAGGNGGAQGGGAGAGFIAGINTYQPTTTESWSDGPLSVDTVVAMVLCGGGGCGQAASFISDPGGGGGAWGNGGNSRNSQGGSGPGGATFGRGGNGQVIGTNYGGHGAWCVRDYSTNTFTSGTGAGTTGLTSGQVTIERVSQG